MKPKTLARVLLKAVLNMSEPRELRKDTWKDIHRAADKYTPRARAVARRSFNQAKAIINRRQLAAALQRRDEQTVLMMVSAAIVRFETAFRKPFMAVLQDVFSTAGRASASHISERVTVSTVPSVKIKDHKIVFNGAPEKELPGDDDRITVLGNHLRVTAPKIGFAFDRTNPRAQEWVSEHVGELIEDMSRSTRERVKDLVERAFDGEFDTHDLADHIADLIGDDARAETIARTETMAASNGGQREAWAQAVEDGLLNGDEQEEWIVTPDDKLCEICQPMDGALKPLGGKFNVNGELMDGPPAHPRCRCTTGLSIAT